MDKKQKLFIFMLVLALIVTLALGTIYRKYDEGFVETKSCLSLSSDQVIQAYEMCNNLVASDPSNCQVMVEALACPIKGVAMNAMFTKVDATNAATPTATSTYAPFASS